MIPYKDDHQKSREQLRKLFSSQWILPIVGGVLGALISQVIIWLWF